MNREQAKQLLPIIQAFADGAAVQRKRLDMGEWEDICGLCIFDDCEYRIKPKPLERWIVLDSDDDQRGQEAFATHEAAIRFVDRANELQASALPFRIIHMREVTP